MRPLGLLYTEVAIQLLVCSPILAEGMGGEGEGLANMIPLPFQLC